MMAVSPAAKNSRDIVRRAEDPNKNSTDIPVAMQRQLLVIQKAQRTVDIPLLLSQDRIAKYNEIQMDKKLRSA